MRLFQLMRFLGPGFLSVLVAGPASLAVGAEIESTAQSIEITVPRKADGSWDKSDVRAWRDWLLAQGYAVDRCGHNPKAGTLTVNVESETQRRQLLDAGFEPVPGSPPPDTILTQSQYFDPTEIASMLAQVEADHQAIARRFAIGTTTQGRTIWALEISDQPNQPEDEPAIQFNGQHHAREVATSHVVMDIIELLTNGYGTDPLITAWVNQYTTVCVPMVNPDGVQHVFNGASSWRKNRMMYPPTCIGVDLNRNYPYLFGPGCGSSGTCTSDIYRGPSDASELETQAMISLQDQYHFVMATSYHSFGQFIDYPYACSNGSPAGQMPEHAVIHEMMHGVSDGIFAMDGTRYDVYSPVPFGGVNGDDTSWYYAHRGVYAFIIEVGTLFEPPFAQVAGIVNQNRGGWRYMYERLGEARIDVHVRDACTNSPLEAEVTLKDYVYDTGELPRITSPPYGRWTYMVPANGGYTVRASKAGYLTQDAPVAVSNSPESVEILLVPEDAPPQCTADIPATSTYGLVLFGAAMLSAGALIHRKQSAGLDRAP